VGDRRADHPEKAVTNRSPTPRYVGQPLPRFEDLRLVRGRGRYTDDFAVPDQVYAAFVRSPHGHARIRGIDTSAAKHAPGVLAVLTGAEYLADGCKGIRHVPVPRDTLRHDLPAFTSTASRPVLDEPHFPLAIERVRHVGEAIAVVVAETVFAARDAAERIEVEYEPLPAVTDIREAIAPGAPLLWEAARNNIAVEGEFGDRAATERAFAAAEIVIEHEFRNQRIVNAQMEPRAAIGTYDAKNDSYLMIAGSQGAVRQREYLAAALNAPLERVHVVCPDVGGGFGPRSNIYAEQVVVTWAARRVGRPVRWTSDRSEAFLTDYQGRDSLAGTVRFAFQPAEERIGGAQDMIKDGVLENPRVDRVFGLHIMAHVPVGEVCVTPGPIMAAATHFRIIIRGKGGHASSPQDTVDPIVVAAHVIVALQTVVSRSVDPGKTAVLTIGRLEGGKRGNIIPNEVMMSGTVRTFEADVCERVLARMDELLAGVTSAWGATYQFDRSTLPAVVNDAECAALVAGVAGALLGPERVAETRVTGSDDMAYFLEARPGCYFFLGGGNAAKGITYPHHPRFDFDEDCLGLGIELGLRIIEAATGSSLLN